jgi:hypothetical protein
VGCGRALLLLLLLLELLELLEPLPLEVVLPVELPVPPESVFGTAGGAAAIALCTLFTVLDG